MRCKTVDLEVPARAEIVIEGYIAKGELRDEGPFGDHTGYYTPREPFPVVHVTAVTTRRDPIYPSIIVGVPPQEDAWLGKATERLFLPAVRMTMPEVVDYDLPVEGAFHNLCIVAIRKAYPGHARKVMHAIWGTGLLSLTKGVVVVDADVDVHDYAQVMWQVGANVDPARDVVLADGPLDHLDHAPTLQFHGGKIGIDATAKGPADGYDARLAGADPDERRRARACHKPVVRVRHRAARRGGRRRPADGENAPFRTFWPWWRMTDTLRRVRGYNRRPDDL